jgi:hypothetical protein
MNYPLSSIIYENNEFLEVPNISNVYPKAQPILKDTVKEANQTENVKDIASNGQPPENIENDKIATLIEAGKYERKSISFINSLLCIDGSAKNIPSDDLKYALEKINEKLKMSRFDYNPLPQNLIDSFANQANAAGDLTDDKLADILDKTLLPKILEIVDFYKEARAQTHLQQFKNATCYISISYKAGTGVVPHFSAS